MRRVLVRRIFLAAFVLAGVSGTPLFASAAVRLDEPNMSALTTGLVGYWPLDGQTTNWTTNTTQDVSGNGNTGTLVGMSTTTSPVPGVIGQALKFNGSNNYINAGNAASLQITGPITLSAWFKATSLPTVSGSYYSIVAKGYNGVNTGYQLDLQNDASTGNAPQLLCASYNGASHGAGYSYGSNIVTGKWYNALCTFDGAVWRSYLNGVQVASSVDSTGPQSTPKSVLVGGLDIGGTLHYFPGALDEVHIYNRALSAQEVALLYALGSAKAGNSIPASSPSSFNFALSAGLVGYWPLDGNTTSWTTDTTKDISGNGNTGTMVNMSTTTSPAAGRIGGGFQFSTHSPVQHVTSANTIPTSANWTMSAWIKYSSVSNFARPLGLGASGPVFWNDGSGSFGIVHSSTVDWQPGYILTANQWTLITVTRVGSTITLYVNGVRKFQNTSFNTSYTFGKLDAGTDSQGIADPFLGVIDDVRIYNRALSAQEVQQLYAAGQVNLAHSNTSMQSGVGVNSGLVGYWTFDGPNINWRTNTAVDSSGQGNTGTLVGMSTTSSPTAGKIGQALQFDGSSSYVTLARSSSLSPIRITISLWWRAKSGGASQYLIDSGNDGYYTIQTNGLAGFFTSFNNVTHNFLTNFTFKSGSWYHIVVTYDGNNVITYVNGSQQGIQAIAGSPNILYAPANLNIGSAGGALFASGTIDDVRIYNRALSAQEVAQLYSMGR